MDEEKLELKHKFIGISKCCNISPALRNVNQYNNFFFQCQKCGKVFIYTYD